MHSTKGKKMNPKLLDTVRDEVLVWAAIRGHGEYAGFGLSNFCRYVEGDRGHIHRCLSLLAKEGIMYERSHTEGYVAPYEHCETDKRFRIRITKEAAIAILDERKIDWRSRIQNPMREQNKYAHKTLFKLP